MTEFTIIPYVGPFPITFDMTPSEVAKSLGPADRVSVDFMGDTVEQRGLMNIGYSRADRKVCHVGFLPRARLLFEGRFLFEEQDVISFLMQFDAQPHECLGFIVFFGLGIAVSGFHDQDESQKAITVFRKGRWDEFRDRAEPYVPKSASCPRPRMMRPGM